MARYAILKGVGHINRPNKLNVGNPGRSQNWPEMWRKWPHLVAQGPSGQLAILPPFSGAGSDAFSTGKLATEGGAAFRYYAYEDLVNHNSVAWKHNSCLHWWRFALDSARSDIGQRWHPYQWEVIHKNASGPIFDNNNNFNLFVIEDGNNNTLHIFEGGFVGNGTPGVVHGDGIYWQLPGGTQPTNKYGNWTGQLPFEVASGHKFPGMRMFGNPGDFEDSHWNFPAQQGAGGLSEGLQAWVSYIAGTADPRDQTFNICDMIEFEGSIWQCNQTMVWANRIGTKGSFIYADFWDVRQDEFGGSAVQGTANVDINRGTQNKFAGPKAKKFAKHHFDGENRLYMLQNDGKVFDVQPGGIRLLADLTKDIVNSPFGSGIQGGSLQVTPIIAAGQWPRPRTFRPFLISFNNQLHAFLNYKTSSSIFATRTGTPVGKDSDGFGNVEGVAWFTSFDGKNWQDRTDQFANVSQSGIITPSGNIVKKATWTAITAPYIYSAFQNANFPSGYGPRLGYPDSDSKFGTEASQITGNTAPENRGTDADNNLKPSGFRQATGEPKETASRHQDDVAAAPDGHGGDTDRLPIWTSGNLQDTPGTPFNLLQIKLDMGTVSGWLYPTIVDYPSGFDFIDPVEFFNKTIKPTNLLPEVSGGVWGPFGQGARGWDFTGVRGKHITGYIDEADEQTNSHELKLCFSDNPPQTNDLRDNQVASHFFTLNKASGWRQVNYVHWGGAFCGGYQAIDLHDPEVIIPSGSIDDPNPFIDPINERMRIRYKVLDFGFWDTVQMKFQYTTDEGLNWRDATISGSLLTTTGTKQIDPSGIGTGRGFSEIFWLYPDDIGRNVFFPTVRIRMRAEVK